MNVKRKVELGYMCSGRGCRNCEMVVQLVDAWLKDEDLILELLPSGWQHDGERWERDKRYHSAEKIFCPECVEKNLAKECGGESFEEIERKRDEYLDRIK